MSSRYSESRHGERDRSRDREERERPRSGRDRSRDREPHGDDRREDRSRRPADEDERDDRRNRERHRDDKPRRETDDDKRHRRRDRSESPERRRHHKSSRRSDSPDGRRRRRSDESGSESGSGSGSDSDSDDSRDRRRRKKERRKDKKRDKESREERKARKARKKDKKHKKTAAVTSQWGTYGIISDSDFNTKQSEFRSWLIEERKVNPETVSKDKERKEFSRFVEDFNTATLPHEKYYDMAKYEIKMQMIRTGGSMPMDMLNGGYDPNADLAAHSSNLRRPAKETASFLSREQLEDLRRVQNERIEVAQRKVLGMNVSKNLGVRQEEQNKLYR